MFSIVAMGRVGEDLVYRKRKKISDVKKYTKTINPNTPGQQTQKGYFQNAILAWQTDGYSSIDIRAWDIYARAKKVKASGFNMFTGFRISAEKAGKTWGKLKNCTITDVTAEGFKVEINVSSDLSGVLYIGTSKVSMLKEFVGAFAVNKYTFTVTGLEKSKIYYFYIKNTSANEYGRTGIYKQRTEAVSPPVIIEVGTEAILRQYTGGTNYTFVNTINPADGKGKITSVEIWAKANMSNCKVGIFFAVSAYELTTRDYITIGNVEAGSKKIFVTNLDIEIGDFIGIHYSPGNINYDLGVSGNNWWESGNHIPCTNKSFHTNGSYIMSLGGSGIAS